MNLESTDTRLVALLFNQQTQPAFWLVPVWNNEQDICDFEYCYCNKEFFSYTGLIPEKVLGKRVLNSPAISSQQARQKLFHEILEVYTKDIRQQSWLYNPDLKRYYSYTRNKVADGVLTVLQDRTEEYDMMQRLEEQKLLMDNILKHSSNAITVGRMIRNKAGTIQDVKTILANEAAQQYTSISKEDYLGKTARELDPNFTSSAYFQMCVRCMETGEPGLMQYHLEQAGKWLEVSVSKMDEEHQIYIFTDVTSIKEAQLSLERSAYQLQTIINRAQSGIFTLLPMYDQANAITDFRFGIVNKALAAYVNQPPEALTGTLASDHFKAYLSNGLFKLFCASFETGKTNRFEFHYNEDGIDAWIDMMCTRFEGEVLVTFTDYTTIKKLQLEQELLVEELHRSNANLEEFAYAASHDLQEPLRKIHYFSERLKTNFTKAAPEENYRMLERMEAATTRMRTLISDLLTYSQMSIKPDLHQLVDLDNVLQQVMLDLEASISETGATIRFGGLPQVRGDASQICQLFQNLISNAIKYRKAGVTPEVTITCTHIKENDLPTPRTIYSEKGLYYKIEVADNGIGFEQDHAEKIFQVFQRLPGRSEYEGTGIGLAIVQKVVLNHGGLITAWGNPAKGAIFRIILPA